MQLFRVKCSFFLVFQQDMTPINKNAVGFVLSRDEIIYKVFVDGKIGYVAASSQLLEFIPGT